MCGGDSDSEPGTGTDTPGAEPTIVERVTSVIDSVTNAVGEAICNIVGETPPSHEPPSDDVWYDPMNH